MEKQRNWLTRNPFWIITILALLLILGLYIFVNKSSTFVSNNDNSIKTRSVIFCKSIQQLILDYLKAPATAIFQDCDEAEINTNETTIEVNTYVDAQNSYGALIREKIYGKEELIDGEWKLDYLSIDKNVYYDRRIHDSLKEYLSNGSQEQSPNNQRPVETESNTIPIETKQETTATWHETTAFSGKDTKDTDTFMIKGDRFKLTYTVSPEPEYPEYASFSVYAFEPGNDIYVAYASLDSGTDSSVSYAGSGEYYLKIVAANLEGWTVKVEDYY